MTEDEQRKPPPSSRASQSLGGLRSAANMTPEERRARAKKAVERRWALENERRAAEGRPLTKKSRSARLEGEALERYLARVDEMFPGRVWKYAEDRKRQAIALARADAASMAREVFGDQGD